MNERKKVGQFYVNSKKLEYYLKSLEEPSQSFVINTDFTVENTEKIIERIFDKWRNTK